MDDDEIRDGLGMATTPSAPTAQSFEAIMRRAQRGRARLLGVALVLALVAGPTAGVLIGMNLDDGGHPVTVASGSQDSRRDATASPPQTATASGSASASASSGVMGFAGEPKLTPLFARTTADGIAIRAYQADIPAPPEVTRVQCPEGAACPEPGKPTLPAECFPSAILRAELSNQAAVDPGFLTVSKLGADQTMAVVQAGFFGIAEGSPAAWAAVHTSDAVTTVRVHFADGTVDEMAPVQGYAVLAHQTAAPPQPAPTSDPETFRKATVPEGTVEGLDGSGTVVASAALADAVPASPSCALPAPVPLPAPDQAPKVTPAPPVTTAS